MNLFISYSHGDQDSLEHLMHYINEKSCPHVNIWYDGEISLGVPWDDKIRQKLADSQVILLIISQNFLDSDYINRVELIAAFEKQRRELCRVIPIFAKSCDLESHPHLLDLQGFPRDQRPFNKMKEVEKPAQYTVLQKELNQLIKEVLREKISLRLSILNSNKIFLSIPQSDEEKETRNRFVSEVEQKRKYENWGYQIIPALDQINNFYQKDAHEQAAFIAQCQKEALYSIQLVASESLLDEGIGKLQYDLAAGNGSNDPIYRRIIWVLDGMATGRIDKGISMNPRVCGSDPQKMFELINSLDEDKEKEITELGIVLRRRKNIFMFYDFKKDHENETRIALKTKIEQYKNKDYQNIDIRLAFSNPIASLKQEEKFLEGSEGGFIFYGKADPYWFARRQAILLDCPTKQAKCICIDEPDIEEKVRRDLNNKPFTTEQFTIIKGSSELESGVKDFLDYLLRENS